MEQKSKLAVETKHIIGKTTYVIYSSSSESATDTLDRKINKLIRKDIVQNTVSAQK